MNTYAAAAAAALTAAALTATTAAPATAATARANVPVPVASRENDGVRVTIFRWTGDGHRTARADFVGGFLRNRAEKSVTITYRCGNSRWRQVTREHAATARLPRYGRCSAIATGRWGWGSAWQPAKVRRTPAITSR